MNIKKFAYKFTAGPFANWWLARLNFSRYTECMNVFAKPYATRRLFPSAILVLTLAVFLGAGYAGMSQNATGQMSACPSMSVVKLCEMSWLAHMDKWQGLFSALPEREDVAFLALILLGFSLTLLSLRSRDVGGAYAITSHMLRSRVAHVPVRSYLQEAFSRGILHPKIF